MASQNNSKYDANGYNSSGRRQIVGVKTKPNEFQEMARNLETSGFKVKDGQLTPTQDYGQMVGLASEQRNGLSRGAKSISTLGNPMGSMYAANPGFFNRGGSASGGGGSNAAGGVEGFGQMLAQTREQRIAQSQRNGTFDTIRDKFNQDNSASGSKMNKFGNIMAGPIQGRVPMRSGLMPQAGPNPSTANRQNLEQRAAGLKLLRETQQSPMQVTEQGGGKNLVGQYGTGWPAPTTPGAKRSEGMVNGRPFSEVMQGLANKQGNLGTGQATDKFQPQTDNFKGVKLANVKLADKRKPLSRA